MQPRSLRSAAWLSLALLALAQPARADDPSPLRKLAEESLARKERLFRLRAEVRVYQWERACLDEANGQALPNAGAGVASFARSQDLPNRIRAHLGAELKRPGEHVKSLADSQAQNEAAALARWREAVLAESDLTDSWIRQEDRLGVNLDRASAWTWTDELQLRVGLGGVSVNVTAWAVLVLLVSLLLGLHSVRRDLRSGKRIRGAKVAAAALALACLSGCGAGASAATAGAGPERFSAEKARLNKELTDLQKEIASAQTQRNALKAQVEAQRKKIVAGWVQFLAEAPGGGEGPLAGAFRTAEAAAYRHLHDALVAAHTAELAAAEGAAVVDRAERRRAQLEQRLSQEEGLSVTRGAVRAGWCAALAGLMFTPMWLVRRRARNRLVADARRCPCCDSQDRFEPKDPAAKPGEHADPMLRCTVCNFLFPTSWRRHPRLAFPLVGITQSGKTHWLLSVYDKVNRHQIPVRSAFDKCDSPADAEYEQLVEQVLEKGRRLPGTQYGLNFPLVFHAKDRDRLLPSQGMVNLFDFSGELMKRSVYKDSLRKRALQMSGFLLFLDPTQVDALSTTGQLIRDQISAVRRFNDELRKERGLGVGDELHVPVAVCISKLDLLTTLNPMQRRAVKWVAEVRKTSGDPVNLKTLQKRSKLCEDVLSVMFPGWEVQRNLAEAFGGRYLFFPVAPVGLEESILGKNDPRSGEIVCSSEPFGVFEPVLWLLHMHGYCVFD